MKQSCPIGSVKTNIWPSGSGVRHRRHAEGAAADGARNAGAIPQHSAELNEGIDFASSQFYVQQRVQEWMPKELDGVRFPRRAGISAIGAGGTNAHVVLEEYAHAPRVDHPGGRKDRSSRSPPRAKRNYVKRRLACFASLIAALVYAADDVAHTLQTGRKSFEHRLVIVAADLDDLAHKLDAYLQGQAHDAVMSGCVKNADGVIGLLSGTEKQEFIDLLGSQR